jgi:spore coat polysaccharide biosynthesis predicted glycosyltransferase SpsG
MKNIIIRCDGGEIPNLGTGHVIRCVTICKYLIKNYGFKKKNFLFLIKTKKKFKIGKKILDLEKFNYENFPNNIEDFSLDEVNIIKKFNPKLVLIDRLGFVSKKYLSILRKSKIKSILIDNSSKFKKYSNFYINPLIFNKIKKNEGYNYSIFPSILIDKKDRPQSSHKKKIKVFLFFGGFDYNGITLKIIRILKDIKNIDFIIDKRMAIHFKNKNYSTYDNKNFYNNLSNSDYAIVSGGLIVFDAIKYNLPTICVPQYFHQKKTILNLEKKKLISYLRLDKNLKKNILNLFNEFRYKPSVTHKMKYFQRKFIHNLKYKIVLEEIKNQYEN